MSRNASLDHIRIFLTTLVVFHHTAIAYGGSGGWYWREEENASSLFLVAFNCINQSYFMGFFFLLAGYFSTASLNRKSGITFLLERTMRLGLPLLVYYFLLSPFTIALSKYADGQNLLASIKLAFEQKLFGPGPLWFAAALLAMSLSYSALRSLGLYYSPKKTPSMGTLFLCLLNLGLISFAIRQWIPVGKEVMWIQPAYFAPYIFLFFAGAFSRENRLLEHITWSNCKPWFICSVLCFIALGFILSTRFDKGGFEGGWNLNALIYALWDPFFAAGVILTILWSFQRWLSKGSALSRAAARGTYTVYIIHAPVVVLFSALAVQYDLAPLLKLLIVGSLSSLSCFTLASVLIKIPGLNRIL